MTDVEVLRYAAFTDNPSGGNPAGVVLDARNLSDSEQLAIAAEVGYSETAFLVAAGEPRRYAVRYFSPLAEVPFCGHATLASAVALGERNGVGPIGYHARDPFPPGDVVEDPATGAAAAAFTGYLRELDHIGEGAVITISQGVDMGRPSTLTCESVGARVRVSGAAAEIVQH